MTRSRSLTLLACIQAVREGAVRDRETPATVADRITSGQGRLGGDAAGITGAPSAPQDEVA